MAVALIASILTCVALAIRPIKISKKLSLDMITGSVLSLVLLLLTGIIDLETLKLGILGDENLSPWKIIIIFFTVAYAAISTDITGIFEVLAFKIVRWSQGNTRKLFLAFYLFAAILTIFTSNDIVILTLTPIIFYLGKHAKLNIIPFLFAEFFGANTLSMMLMIGNPTNIIIADALDIGFFQYIKVMFIPTIVATITNYVLLYQVFKKDLAKKHTLKSESKVEVRSYLDVAISAVLLILMLVALLLSEPLGLEIWIITSFFCILFLFEDLVFYIFRRLPTKNQSTEEKYQKHSLKSDLHLAFKRMPWGILPFIFTIFVCVGALNQTGIFQNIAIFIGQFSQSTLSSIFSFGISGLLTANIINNQPMSIMFSSLLLSAENLLTAEAFKGASFATVIASNLGANLTLIGALAGLMWRDILKAKGLDINYWKFLKVGLIVTPITATITFLTLWIVISIS